MDGWMDGWMDKWTDDNGHGWTSGRTIVDMDGWMMDNGPDCRIGVDSNE